MSLQNGDRVSSLDEDKTMPNQSVKAKANEEAVKYLSAIDDGTWESLLFSDSLITTSETGKEIGEMKITVEPATWKDEPCYLVHANSHGVIDSLPIGTSVTAYVDRSLKTLEQTHYEYVKIPDQPLDRRTFLALEDNVYTVRKTMSQGVEVEKTEFQLTADELDGFISEGSNLLLQRVMVKKGVPQGIVFTTFDTDTHLRTSTYRSLGEKTETIASKQQTLIGIERTIDSVDDSPSTWHAYFLTSGHLALRTQLGSQVKMSLLNLPGPGPGPVPEDELPKSTTEEKKPKPLKWDEDMQLYSRFLDRKAELSDDHATYMRRHPELRALLADFLQFLLLRKPDDVCEFASDFFSAFSSGSPSGPSFARSEPSQPSQPSPTVPSPVPSQPSPVP